MEQKIGSQGKTQSEINRETMSPASYLTWLTERMSDREKEEIYKRKLGIVEQMTSAVNGPLSLNNKIIDVIVAGEVPPETVDGWIKQELDARKEKSPVVPQQSRQERAAPHGHVGKTPIGNYNTDIVAQKYE